MEFMGIEVKKKQKLDGMEIYEEEEKTQPIKNEEEDEGFLKKVWNKTIFPQMIKDKKEEKALKRKIYSEAKKEAIIELKDEMKKKIKQKEIDKLSGKKGNFLGKLGQEFAEMGSKTKGKDLGSLMGGRMGGGNFGSTPVSNDRIAQILGTGKVRKSNKDDMSLGLDTSGKIDRMLEKGSKKKKEIHEVKLRRILE